MNTRVLFKYRFHTVHLKSFVLIVIELPCFKRPYKTFDSTLIIKYVWFQTRTNQGKTSCRYVCLFHWCHCPQFALWVWRGALLFCTKIHTDGDCKMTQKALEHCNLLSQDDAHAHRKRSFKKRSNCGRCIVSLCVFILPFLLFTCFRSFKKNQLKYRSDTLNATTFKSKFNT